MQLPKKLKIVSERRRSTANAISGVGRAALDNLAGVDAILLSMENGKRPTSDNLSALRRAFSRSCLLARCQTELTAFDNVSRIYPDDCGWDLVSLLRGTLSQISTAAPALDLRLRTDILTARCLMPAETYRRAVLAMAQIARADGGRAEFTLTADDRRLYLSVPCADIKNPEDGVRGGDNLINWLSAKIAERIMHKYGGKFEIRNGICRAAALRDESGDALFSSPEAPPDTDYRLYMSYKMERENFRL